MTSFAKAIDNVSTVVTSPRAVGGTSLAVADASRIALGAGAWARLTIARSGSVVTVLKVTGASGNTLTIAGPADSYADAACNVGDVAELRVDAGAFSDIQFAVNTLEVAPASSLRGGATVRDWAEIGWGHGTWIDMPTTAPSGIGSGGIGANAWVAYCQGPGNWFSDAQAGDLAYRNGGGRILFGNTGGHSALQIATNAVSCSIAIRPAHLAESQAPVDSIYFSTDANALVYKDPGGVTRPLY